MSITSNIRGEDIIFNRIFQNKIIVEKIEALEKEGFSLIKNSSKKTGDNIEFGLWFENKRGLNTIIKGVIKNNTVDYIEIERYVPYKQNRYIAVPMIISVALLFFIMRKYQDIKDYRG